MPKPPRFARFACPSPQSLRPYLLTHRGDVTTFSFWICPSLKKRGHGGTANQHGREAATAEDSGADRCADCSNEVRPAGGGSTRAAALPGIRPSIRRTSLSTARAGLGLARTAALSCSITRRTAGAVTRRSGIWTRCSPTRPPLSTSSTRTRERYRVRLAPSTTSLLSAPLDTRGSS